MEDFMTFAIVALSASDYRISAFENNREGFSRQKPRQNSLRSCGLFLELKMKMFGLFSGLLACRFWRT
jgi:hypothetical protein